MKKVSYHCEEGKTQVKTTAPNLKELKMEMVFNILAGWFLISIPVSLIAGQMLARRSEPVRIYAAETIEARMNITNAS